MTQIMSQKWYFQHKFHDTIMKFSTWISWFDLKFSTFNTQYWDFCHKFQEPILRFSKQISRLKNDIFIWTWILWFDQQSFNIQNSKLKFSTQTSTLEFKIFHKFQDQNLGFSIQFYDSIITVSTLKTQYWDFRHQFQDSILSFSTQIARLNTEIFESNFKAQYWNFRHKFRDSKMRFIRFYIQVSAFKTQYRDFRHKFQNSIKKNSTQISCYDNEIFETNFQIRFQIFDI